MTFWSSSCSWRVTEADRNSTLKHAEIALKLPIKHFRIPSKSIYECKYSPYRSSKLSTSSRHIWYIHHILIEISTSGDNFFLYFFSSFLTFTTLSSPQNSPTTSSDEWIVCTRKFRNEEKLYQFDLLFLCVFKSQSS